MEMEYNPEVTEHGDQDSYDNSVESYKMVGGEIKDNIATEAFEIETVNDLSSENLAIEPEPIQTEIQIDTEGSQADEEGSEVNPEPSEAPRRSLVKITGPKSKLQEILDRTGYPHEKTATQSIYGPPPGREDEKLPAGTQVHIGKISFSVTIDELIEVFEEVGEIYEMRLMLEPKMPGRNKGFAFVTYYTKEIADEAVKKFNNYVINSKNITCVIAQSNNNLFIGMIPKDKSQEEIKEAFSNEVSGIVSVLLQPALQSRNTSEKNRGFCFLNFEDYKSAAAARQKLRSKVPIRMWNDHKSYTCDWADPQEEISPELMAQVKTLFVKNISEQTSELMLRERFSSYGTIDKVVVHRHYAFVFFVEREDALRAIDGENGKLLGDTTISVELARPVSEEHRKKIRDLKEKRNEYVAPSSDKFGGRRPPFNARGAPGSRQPPHLRTRPRMLPGEYPEPEPYMQQAEPYDNFYAQPPMAPLPRPIPRGGLSTARRMPVPVHARIPGRGGAVPDIRRVPVAAGIGTGAPRPPLHGAPRPPLGRGGAPPARPPMAVAVKRPRPMVPAAATAQMAPPLPVPAKRPRAMVRYPASGAVARATAAASSAYTQDYYQEAEDYDYETTPMTQVSPPTVVRAYRRPVPAAHATARVAPSAVPRAVPVVARRGVPPVAGAGARVLPGRPAARVVPHGSHAYASPVTAPRRTAVAMPPVASHHNHHSAYASAAVPEYEDVYDTGAYYETVEYEYQDPYGAY